MIAELTTSERPRGSMTICVSEICICPLRRYVLRRHAKMKTTVETCTCAVDTEEIGDTKESATSFDNVEQCPECPANSSTTANKRTM